MAEALQPQKIPMIFYRLRPGNEPVREWLKGLQEAERHAIGKDLLRAQWRWPAGMPLCRPLGNGLSEVRTDLRRGGRRAYCFAFATGTSSRCTGLSRKRARRRRMIWHWRAGGRRS